MLLAINKTDDKRSLKSALNSTNSVRSGVRDLSGARDRVAELLDEIVERLGRWAWDS